MPENNKALEFARRVEVLKRTIPSTMTAFLIERDLLEAAADYIAQVHAARTKGGEATRGVERKVADDTPKKKKRREYMREYRKNRQSR